MRQNWTPQSLWRLSSTFINFNLECEPQSTGRSSTQINRDSAMAYQLLQSTWRPTNKITVRDYCYFSKHTECCRAGGEPARLRAEHPSSRQDKQPPGSSSIPGRCSGCTTRTFCSDVRNNLKFHEPGFAFHCLLTSWKEAVNTPLSCMMPGTLRLQQKCVCFFPFFLPASPFPLSKLLVY